MGVKLRKILLLNGLVACSTSLSKYVQESVKNVKGCLIKEYDWRRLANRASTIFLNNDKPELDMIPDLGPNQASHYQKLIGVLH